MNWWVSDQRFKETKVETTIVVDVKNAVESMMVTRDVKTTLRRRGRGMFH